MEQLKNESSRQYEYMEEMKKWVQKKSEELGRKLTCHVTTFGCQMNEKDSEKLLGILVTILKIRPGTTNFAANNRPKIKVIPTPYLPYPPSV